jgi:hypothetical protein
MSRSATAATNTIREMRDFLFSNATDYEAARAGFSWPHPSEFNFALEWFDVVADENPDRPAVQIVEADLSLHAWTYGELSARSDQVANWLTDIGIRRGDHVIVMLGNMIELWEVMLAITKIGAVSIPTSTLLSASDLAYRIEHGRARAVVTLSSLANRLDGVDVLRIGVGDAVPADWVRFADGVRAAGADPGIRHRPALLHQRHHQPPQARAAHPRLVPDRASVDHVVAGGAARRRAPEHLLPRLGEARVVELLLALPRRGDRVRLQLRPLRRECSHAGHGCASRVDVLRSADRVADADPGRSRAARASAA